MKLVKNFIRGILEIIRHVFIFVMGSVVGTYGEYYKLKMLSALVNPILRLG